MRKGNDDLVDGIATCGELEARLRARLAPFGEIGKCQLSCSNNGRNRLFAMVEVVGDPHRAAKEIGGFVFGADLVCGSWNTPPSFQCGAEDRNAVFCLGKSTLA